MTTYTTDDEENPFLPRLIAVLLIACLLGLTFGGALGYGVGSARTRQQAGVELAAMQDTYEQKIASINAAQHSAQNVAANVPRQEYYRGVYDMCNFVNANMGGVPQEQSAPQCLEFIQKIVDGKWYEENSRGWEWGNE